MAFHGQLLKTEIFDEEEEETSEEIPEEAVSPSPTAKTDSKKAAQSKTDKQKTGGRTSVTIVSGKKSGKMSVSRGTNSRASSPSPPSRPASAEKEKKPVYEINFDPYLPVNFVCLQLKFVENFESN